MCVRQKHEQRELTRCRDELEQAGRERQRLERVAADVVSSSSPPHMTTNNDLVEKLKVSVYICVYLHYVYILYTLDISVNMCVCVYIYIYINMYI